MTICKEELKGKTKPQTRYDGVCQRGIGDNWTSSQWPGLGRFEQQQQQKQY